jgi:hypothetical protein
MPVIPPGPGPGIVVLGAVRTAVNAGPSVQWGDVPTWLLAAIALAALVAAVLAYLKQADAAQAVSKQVKLQGDQLEDQRAANAKQAEVLDAQLREMRQRETIIERQQAEGVELRQSASTAAPPGIPAPRGRVHAGEVANRSYRPIRDVACRIQPVPDDGLYDADVTGQLIEMGMPPGGRALVNQAAGSRVRLIRAGETWLFAFPYDTGGHPVATIIARFTDDAGLYWEIDHDQHLVKLPDRNDW